VTESNYSEVNARIRGRLLYIRRQNPVVIIIFLSIPSVVQIPRVKNKVKSKSIIIIITVQTDVVCYMCTWCRNLPLSIAISVSAITVLYVFTNFSYFVVLGIDGVLQSDAVAMVCLLSFCCMHNAYELVYALSKPIYY